MICVDVQICYSCPDYSVLAILFSISYRQWDHITIIYAKKKQKTKNVSTFITAFSNSPE